MKEANQYGVLDDMIIEFLVVATINFTSMIITESVSDSSCYTLSSFLQLSVSSQFQLFIVAMVASFPNFSVSLVTYST